MPVTCYVHGCRSEGWQGGWSRRQEPAARPSLPARFSWRQGRAESARLARMSPSEEIEGLSGQDSGDVTVAGAPFAAVPGVPLVVAKSKQMRFSDYGLKWEVSNKNSFFSPFAYQSA